MDVLRLKYYFQYKIKSIAFMGLDFLRSVTTFLGNCFLADDFVGDLFSGCVSSESVSLEGWR
jgi:hypothetical protein